MVIDLAAVLAAALVLQSSHDVLRDWALLPTLAKSTGEAELLASLEALLKATAKAGEVTQRVQGRGVGRLRQRLATNPARGFQLVGTCDRRIGQPAHFSTNDRLCRRRRDWEGSMPTPPGGVRSSGGEAIGTWQAG